VAPLGNSIRHLQAAGSRYARLHRSCFYRWCNLPSKRGERYLVHEKSCIFSLVRVRQYCLDRPREKLGAHRILGRTVAGEGGAHPQEKCYGGSASLGSFLGALWFQVVG
jgi:hypothetical protein